MCWRLRIFVMLIVPVIFGNCSGDKKSDVDVLLVDSAFKSSLIERQVGQSNFFISLPTTYSMKETEGPDFSVYYFASSDTVNKDTFTGGFYFGNHPSEFAPKNDSCKIKILKGRILEDFKNWIVYDCDTVYSIQTIIENKNSEGWNNQLHAFGHGRTEPELNKILEIYSTFKLKK